MYLPKLNSLYGRIFTVFWITILLIVMIVLSLPHLDPRKSHPLSPQDKNHLVVMKQRIETQFSHMDDLHMIVERLSHPTRHNKDKRMLIFLTDLDGRLISNRNTSAPRFRALHHFISSMDDMTRPQRRMFGRFTILGPMPIQLAHNHLFLYVGLQFDHPPSLIIQLIDRPTAFLLLVMLISTPLLLWLAWALSRPVHQFSRAAQRVAKGEFQVDPTLENGVKEFRQAGKSFNKMVEAVNGMISGQQRLLSDISHELRSPLTRLTMANALAKRKLGQSSELDRIDTEAQRLEHMISELLELSRMQIDSQMHRETLPLTHVWEDMLLDAQFEAEQLNKQLTFTAIPQKTISGNPNLLTSAVENVIRNAIKYSNSNISVVFSIDAIQQLTILIEDDGPGVPEEELCHIFRPFYRISTARDRHSGGTGLGLTISENAIRQHNGTITAEKSNLGGLKVLLTLPIEK